MESMSMHHKGEQHQEHVNECKLEGAQIPSDLLKASLKEQKHFAKLLIERSYDVTKLKYNLAVYIQTALKVGQPSKAEKAVDFLIFLKQYEDNHKG